MEFLTKEHRSKRGETRILLKPDWATFDPEQILAQVDRYTKAVLEYIEQVAKEKPTFERLVLGFDELVAPIDTLQGCIQNLESSMRTPSVMELSHAVTLRISASEQQIWTHEGFYRAHRSFRMMRAHKKLTKEEKFIIESRLASFKSSGMFLPRAMQRRIAKCESELGQLEERFETNITKSQSIPAYIVTDEKELDGIGEPLVASMREEARVRNIDGWVALSNATHRRGILESATHRPLREAVFRAYETCASELGAGGAEFDNRPVGERILLMRERLAKLAGAPNCATQTIGDHMSGSVKAVRRFLNGMVKPVVRNAKRDLLLLEKFAKSEFGFDLRPWDIEYVRDQYIRKVYGCSGPQLARVLPLSAVLHVLFGCLRSQYGCRIVEDKTASVWHPSVRFYEVYEDSGQLIGGFYLDPYARTGDGPSKQSEFCWTIGLVNRRRKFEERTEFKKGDDGTDVPHVVREAKIVVPVGIVHLNFLGETYEKTPLTHRQVTILFHEFGHLMETLFDRANFPLSGVMHREDDVTEVASLFMENWAWDIEVLYDIIAITRGKRKIPIRMLLAIHRQRPFVETLGRWGLYDYLQQGLVDLELHARPARKGVIGRVVRDVDELLELAPRLHVEENRYPNNFSLFFAGGYAGSAYTYLWSWRWAAAIRSEHLRGPHSIDRLVSRRFRRYLEAASTEPTITSLQKFFARKLPSTKALLEHSRMI